MNVCDVENANVMKYSCAQDVRKRKHGFSMKAQISECFHFEKWEIKKRQYSLALVKWAVEHGER